MPGFDSTLTNNGGADQYTIDVRGNTVAIVNADMMQGVIAWKSTDGGSTFTRIIVDTFRYAPWTGKQLMTDTPFTNDGTCDVIIDKNNNLHVFWGLGRVLDDDTTDQSYSFYPGLQGIMHWSEANDKTALIASGAAFDADGDGVNKMEQPTYSALSSGNVPSGMSTVARLGNTSCMRQPSSAMDANGNIFCLYSVPVELDISDLGANFRDIGIVYSTDGGATWSQSQNVTQVIGKEDDFASTCRVADGFVHMHWQQDEIAGTNLQNNSSSFGNHPVVLNVINYQAIPVSEILAGTIGIVYSTDGGATWSQSQNVTQVIGKEDDFASTCRVADGFVHMHWQQDEIAGTNLQNNSSSFGNHPVVLNVINYQAIPVSEILAGTIGIASVDQPNTGEVMVVNQNYPNPFSSNTKVLIYLTTPGDVTIEVRNAMGALVQTQKHSGLYKGNHELVINGDSLSSGVYTYTLIAGGSSVSKTMMVK